MSSALPDAVNYHRWLLRLLTPHVRGAVLEIGFGYGQYTSELAALAERVLGVDYDEECVANAPQTPANVELRRADLSAADFASRVGMSTFNTAVCLNVLEHIQDDVQALANIRAALAPVGRLLLVVPAHPALYGPMDQLAGHHRRYRRHELAEKLKSAGLRVDRIGYINPLGGLGWWVNAKLFKPQDLSAPSINRQILWFDRYFLPVSRAMNPLTRMFFGQSLFAVGRHA